MPLLKTKGLVIRQADVGESDRILTVFSDTLGKIAVSAKGAKSMRRKILSSARTLSYSEFVLYEGKSIYTLSQCTPIEVFFGLSQDLDAFGVAAYICGFIDFIIQEHELNPQLLRLALNCLHVLNRALVLPNVVLSVFRLKALCLTGFEPVLDGCAVCGDNESTHSFSSEHGGLVCCDCANNAIHVDEDLLQAMRYLVSVPLERLFSFQMSEKLANDIKCITEAFVKYHTGFML